MRWLNAQNEFWIIFIWKNEMNIHNFFNNFFISNQNKMPFNEQLIFPWRYRVDVLTHSRLLRMPSNTIHMSLSVKDIYFCAKPYSTDVVPQRAKRANSYSFIWKVRTSITIHHNFDCEFWKEFSHLRHSTILINRNKW